MQLTNLFEHGDPKDYGYDSCYVLKDGRGFTVGSIGFCTGDECGQEVAEVRLKQENEIKWSMSCVSFCYRAIGCNERRTTGAWGKLDTCNPLLTSSASSTRGQAVR